MQDDVENLWDAARLAQFLGCSPSTVTAKASRKPDDLPPRVPCHLLRWSPETVRAWANGQMPPKRKPGRPRLPA
jgi:hypothetical protein